MISIIDYGVGNLKSVQKAFEYIGCEVELTNSANRLTNASAVVLPGVGAFGDAMENLESSGLIPVIKDIIASKKPFLGICLGMQLLFESSCEDNVTGLGVFKGTIECIPNGGNLKVPHMGWNSIDINPESRLFKGLKNGSFVYFVHSYYLKASDKNIVSSTTNYGVEIHSSIENENVFATQFHPEKSGDVGLQMLRNFADII